MTTYGTSFYKELLENISDGVYVLDRDRRIQYWNEGAFRLTGYKAEEPWVNTVRTVRCVTWTAPKVRTCARIAALWSQLLAM